MSSAKTSLLCSSIKEISQKITEEKEYLNNTPDLFSFLGMEKNNKKYFFTFSLSTYQYIDIEFKLTLVRPYYSHYLDIMII